MKKSNLFFDEARPGQSLIHELPNKARVYCTVDYATNVVGRKPISMLNLYQTNKKPDRATMTNTIWAFRQYLYWKKWDDFELEFALNVWKDSISETFSDFKSMQYYHILPFYENIKIYFLNKLTLYVVTKLSPLKIMKTKLMKIRR